VLARAAKVIAAARPIPELAPVTSAFLPCSNPAIVTLLLDQHDRLHVTASGGEIGLELREREFMK